MITKNLSILLILFSSTLFGQIPDNIISIEDKEFNDYFFDKENIPTIKVEILNLTKEDIKSLKIVYAMVAPFEPRWIEKTGELDIDGTFELELDYAFPYQKVSLTIGELYDARIYANTDLLIQLDANILKAEGGAKYKEPGIKYLGSDGLLNVYLNNHQLFERKKQDELYQSMRKLKRNKKLDSKQFITKFDSVYSIVNKIDEEFIAQNPSDFSWILRNERQSSYYLLLCSRYKGKKMKQELFEKVKKHKSYLTSRNGMKFYKMLSEYLSIRSSMDNPNDTSVVEKTIKFISLLDSIFEQPKSDLLKIKISSKDYVEQKLKMEPVLNSIQTDWCKNVAEEQHDKIIERHASINEIFTESKSLLSNNYLGKPVTEMHFGAKLFKVDSLASQNLLSNLKGSFENKALLINFWATWCNPCLAELPHSKSLYQEVKDLPIEFIYICTSSGSDINQWKSKIAELELSGIHIFVEKNINTELMNLFSVSSYPSYIFINAKGEYKAGAISWISRIDKNRLIELIKE